MTLDHITIRLPWIDSDLMPNRKNGRHWGGTKKSKEKALLYGAIAAREAIGRHAVNFQDQIPVRITFACPDRRRRDLDNLHAACKASLDGISRMLGVDDSRFCPVTLDRVLDRQKQGFVIVEVG